ncbi:hypothetical protein BDY17DRAFT_68230 [Neohortaea acidophila]|uniref:Uncharacterized protein n=1 Tax=Neohortaea acidophila TaxID=245834 RepID=A0A6A6Q1U9_9PEZI|nr:uncharacterized protein BDY17DRAFT_68230 [Neohortaea acidophila]KAF2485964.1 hypothetical protein BDY17DRAFT_68230 [Neohortaea acidophila]
MTITRAPLLIVSNRDILQRERETAQSSALNPTEVFARLQNFSRETEQLSRSPSLATTPPPLTQEESDLEDLAAEQAAWPALVEAGGHPPYPFDILEDFFWHFEDYQHRDEFRDLISFWRCWVSNPVERTPFCACNLARWKKFRRYQQIVRRYSVKREWTAIRAADWESWEEYLKHPASKDWEGQWDFAKYAQVIKARLAKYGFTRPVHLEHDLDQQDKLTNWIEYLGHEYYFYNAHASPVNRSRPWHDDLWQKLVASNVLRSGETYDAICELGMEMKRIAEAERAEAAMNSASAAVLSLEAAIARSPDFSAALQSQLLAQESAKVTAKKSYDAIKSRNSQISSFLIEIRDYRAERDEVERYGYLVRWIEQQIPAIELEMRHASGLERKLSDAPDKRNRKRARSEDLDDGKDALQPGQNGHTNFHPIGATSRASVSPKSKRRKYSPTEDRPPPQHHKDRELAGLAVGSDTPALTTPTIPGTTNPDVALHNDKIPSTPSRPLETPRRSARIAEKLMKKAPSTKDVMAPSSVVPSVVKSSQKRAKRGRKPGRKRQKG